VKLKHLYLAAGASLLAMTVGTPAKAISYYLTGSDTYACNGATSTTCTITYNDFGISYDGTNWSQLTTGPQGSIVISNNLNSNTINFNQSFTTIINSNNDNYVGFQTGSSSFNLSFESPGVDGTTAGAGANTRALISPTSFSTATLNPDTPFPRALSGNGLILAVPFSTSLLALLPLGTFSKRVKFRVLST